MEPDSNNLVSVIVPICNVETYLAQCLESICGQTHENLEIILINDGSTDESLAVMEEFAARDPRVRVIDKPNEGYGATCNRGIDEARGTWVSIIEPDDWIDPDMYEKMTGFADGFEGPVDIVKCPWVNVYEWDDPKTEHDELGFLAGRIPTSQVPFTLAEHPELIQTHPSIWSALYRRDFLNDKHIRFVPYPGAGWADNPFLVETMAQAETIVYLDKAFYHYRSDLPYATLGHTSDEAVARPMNRWIDMTGVLKRLGVTDRGIWEAHYLRGFNYVDGAIYDDGWDNPVVREKTREVFSLMNPHLVLWHPKLRGRRKRFYREVMGINEPIWPNPRRTRYLAQEAAQRLHQGGIKELEDKVSAFVHQRVWRKGERPDEES